MGEGRRGRGTGGLKPPPHQGGFAPRRGIYRFFVGDDSRMGWHGQNVRSASV